MDKESFFEKVYRLTRLIPPGRVTTYGEIARTLGTGDARKVGWALHANRDTLTPCHRVVNKEGRLAKNFAFDGEMEQRNRLEAEGVAVNDDFHVDLQRFMYHFGTNNE